MVISEKNYEKAISLLDEIIKKAKTEDAQFKAESISANKASHSVGESWLVYHTKILKDFLSQNVHP